MINRYSYKSTYLLNVQFSIKYNVLSLLHVLLLLDAKKTIYPGQYFAYERLYPDCSFCPKAGDLLALDYRRKTLLEVFILS